MPELPDLTVYVEALEQRIARATLESIQIANPFLLRTTTPPASDFEGTRVRGVSRSGKRIVIAVEGELHAAIHL